MLTAPVQGRIVYYDALVCNGARQVVLISKPSSKRSYAYQPSNNLLRMTRCIHDQPRLISILSIMVAMTYIVT